MFHQSLYDNEERLLGADLISGFFSAIFMFFQNFLEKKPEILEIGYIRIVFKEIENHIFTAIVDENESILQVMKNLEKISHRFFQAYREQLVNWNLDRNIFTNFNGTIEKILTESDIERMHFIDKVSRLLELIEDSEIKGISIFTSTAELMFSNFVDDKLSQFLVKIIEISEVINYKFAPMIFNHDNYNIFIEEISESLIIAIVMDQNVSITRAKELYQYLFEELQI